METTVEAASFCLASLMRALPARAGLVTIRDTETGDLVCVYGRGQRAERLLTARIRPSDDWIIDTACRMKRAYAPSGDEIANRGLPERHAFFGDPWSVLVAPALSWGRLVATFELIDTMSGDDFTERDAEVATYVAERFAELTSERGIQIGNIAPPPSGLAVSDALDRTG